MTACYNQSMELDFEEGNMERRLALFMIAAAVLCALFSDRIDMAVKGEQRVKK